MHDQTPEDFYQSQVKEHNRGRKPVIPKEKTTAELKEIAITALQDAEQKMHKYAVSCALGESRTRAFDCYQNIRLAARV